MKKVNIRADASKIIGYGHFIRSLALAGYLQDDFKCYFYTFNPIELKPSKYQLEEMARVAEYIPIEADSQETYDSKFLELLSEGEIVVLDNYYFLTEYQKRIKNKGCKLVCIGPITTRHYVSDVVITSGEKSRSQYSLESYTKFLNGLNHSFLRKPFLNVNNFHKESKNINKAVLAVGGADPYNLTNKLINIIHKVKPLLQIFVIAGDTVEISKEEAEKVRIFKNLNAEEIVELFSICDIGFFSASTICIEALACGLPVAAGWYVDNQKDFYRFGVREGLFFPVGDFLDDEIEIKKQIEKIFSIKKVSKSQTIDFNRGKEDIITIFKNL